MYVLKEVRLSLSFSCDLWKKKRDGEQPHPFFIKRKATASDRAKTPEPWHHQRGDFYCASPRIRTLGGWLLCWKSYHWSTNSSASCIVSFYCFKDILFHDSYSVNDHARRVSCIWTSLFLFFFNVVMPSKCIYDSLLNAVGTHIKLILTPTLYFL